VFQGDFGGNQPGTPYVIPGAQVGSTISENAYYNSPTFRVRHAYLTLRNPYVDVLAGQTFDVFGFQNFYTVTSLLGIPNQVSTRTAQFRLSRTFGAGRTDLARRRPRGGAAGAARFAGPRRRCGAFASRSTAGRASRRRVPRSPSRRRFRSPCQASAGSSSSTRSRRRPRRRRTTPRAGACRWTCSRPSSRRCTPTTAGNRASIVGSFVIGTGIADLISAGGNARFPTLPNSMQYNPPPAYTADIDNGLVTFDLFGVAHTIDWYAFKGGLQYYLPGGGRLLLAGNFTPAHSNNLAKLYPRGGAEIELLGASPTPRCPATAA
jgi:hypothetical protein